MKPENRVLRCLPACAVVWLMLTFASSASAGTYPMYQCAAGHPAVSAGWVVFSSSTVASTVLSDTCSLGGMIGDYAFTNGQPGAVTQSKGEGSQVGVALDVPGSAPDVTIQSISAEAHGSSVTGDDAFLGFASAGQGLTGGAELPYGTGLGEYTARDSWTLPQGARDFEAYVNCSTDKSSPTCMFAQSTSIPALNGITLTLADSAAPSVTSTVGSVAAAAASHGTLTGTQTFGFTASDPDAGVREATLTLTPQAGGSAFVQHFSFQSECTYEAWNACPLHETVSGYALNTAALEDGEYTAELTVTDAAGNTASDDLGVLTMSNAPANSALPTVAVPDTVTVGSVLSAQLGAWSAPGGAGSITYTYQWQQCNSEGAACEPITSAEQATYKATTADVAHTLRVLVTASDNDGSATAAASASSVVVAPPSNLGAGNGNGGNAPAGVWNGQYASENAVIHLGVAAVIARAYPQRAFALDGRLLTAEGHPIIGASVEVTQKQTGADSSTLIGTANTGSTGDFSISVPAGASRTVWVSYRALSTDQVFAAQAAVRETVPAHIILRVSKRHVHAHATVVFSGTVSGPLPPDGVTVYMRVHYRGRWRLLAEATTNRSGRFKVAYQFQGAIGRFPFRAEVKANQTGFAYATGYSGAIDVHTN